MVNQQTQTYFAQTTISIRIHTHNGLKHFLKQKKLYKDAENKIFSFFINLAVYKLRSIFFVTDVLKSFDAQVFFTPLTVVIR